MRRDLEYARPPALSQQAVRRYPFWVKAPRPRGKTPPLGFGWILAFSVLGGLLLNLMPCVFPILGLKALSLAKMGGDEGEARRDAVAYTVGIILSCLVLGGIMLALRAAGEEVGWAFQLQDPAIVMLLLLLMVAVTANLAGVFEVGGYRRRRDADAQGRHVRIILDRRAGGCCRNAVHGPVHGRCNGCSFAVAREFGIADFCRPGPWSCFALPRHCVHPTFAHTHASAWPMDGAFPSVDGRAHGAHILGLIMAAISAGGL